MLAHWIRNVAYATILIAAAPWLMHRAVRSGHYRHGWRDKLLGLPPQPPTRRQPSDRSASAPLVWLHGVSVGEIQLLHPLVAELRSCEPHLRFAISTTTETGMELARKLFNDRCGNDRANDLADAGLDDSVQLFYFPLDFSWSVRRTLHALQPALIVLGELELWPNLLDLAQRQQIPIAVVNGRLSERSFRGYQRFAPVTRGMFSKLTQVGVQSETYAERFIRCGTPAGRVIISGSLKFDNVTFDRAAPQIEALRQLSGLSESVQSSPRVWVVGSTQTDEERAAAECFVQARTEFPELKLVVIPRHRERFDGVADELQHVADRCATPLRVVRRSSLASPLTVDAWDILLVDTIGELRWWWGLAEVAVVGGSFGKRGGQNMLEPAAYGINVGFGPNTRNFRDVVELLLAAEAAERIESLQALLPWLLEQLRNPQPGRERGCAAQRLVSEQQGALSRTAKSLLGLLPTVLQPNRRVA